MGWNLVILKSAQKQLGKLEKPTAQRLLVFLYEKVSKLEDPRSIGEALRGEKLGKFWKYRVGDYRMIAKIVDEEIVITVVSVGHRKEIYRNR